MRGKRRAIALGVLILTLLALALPACVLLFDQSDAARIHYVNRTLAEIQRGNYYAWGQVWMWMGRLTPSEEKSLKEACGRYSLTNHLLHVTGIVWPPEPTFPRFRAWSAWLKGGVGMEDRTLAFDVIKFPPLHDLRLNTPEQLYGLSAPEVTDNNAFAGARLTSQPAANPAQ